jgi:hypothetical protein
MANTRIKDISTAATTLNSDDYIAVDGNTAGTRKIAKADLITEVSTGVSGTYLEESNNLSDVASVPDAKGNLEIPDVGSSPDEVSLNGMLGSMAFQSSEGISVAKAEVESTTGTATTQALTVTDGTDTNFIVQEDGKTGIGTDSPDSTLEVTGASATSNNGATVLVTDNASVAADIGGTISLRGSDGSTDRTFAVVKGGKLDGTSAFDGYLSLQTRSNGAANTTEAIRIDHDQKVGIGTSSPDAQTEISKSSAGDILKISGGSETRGLIFTSSTSAAGSVGAKHTLNAQSSNGEIAFAVAGAQKWKVNSTGNLVASSGLGIDFGSGSSTTLDAYEEGLWSATFTPATSGTITLAGSVNALRYTIVGRVAHIQGKVDVTAVSSPVGNYVKVSLPTAVGVPDINEESGSTAGSVVVIGAAGSMNDYTLLAVEGDDHLRIYKGTGSTPVATAADFNGNEEVYINATYIVA